MNEQHLDLNGLKTSDLVRWLRDPEQHYIAIPRDAWFGMYGHSNHTKMQWSYATWPKELVAAQRLEELERERERDAARADLERLYKELQVYRRAINTADRALTQALRDLFVRKAAEDKEAQQ